MDTTNFSFILKKWSSILFYFKLHKWGKSLEGGEGLGEGIGKYKI